MNKNWVIVLAIVVVLVGGYLFLSKGGTPAVTENQPAQTSSDITSPGGGTPVEAGMPIKGAGNVVEKEVIRELTVVGTNFKFSVNEIRVRKGETIKLTFKNEGGKHDWKVDEFKAGTKILDGGQEETVQFVANRVGTFEYYCSVGQHRANGMKGSLIVE
ncbi:MAG: cupredoxin domain-containing protein [Candidatus Liptonbacteria bacterium]|nr:cupredoxin domain-containing protein [Candidatus Liptonbacteria bacterium]